MSPILINDKITTGKIFKIDEFRKHTRVTKPHKHNKYLELVFFTKGTGEHTIDNYKIDIKPNILFVVRREQIHFWNIDTEPEGYVILLKKEYLDNSLNKSLQQLVNKISKYPYLYPTDPETVTQLFQLLLNEHRANLPNNDIVIQGLFKVLLAKLLQSDQAKYQDTKQSLYHKFLDLLNNDSLKFTKVEGYANLLHTSPQNLNNSCRKEADVSASTILADFIIGEAKRLLCYSNLTVQEIAFSLLFKDNSHFTKYFKRATDVTPRQFRNFKQSVPQ